MRVGRFGKTQRNVKNIIMREISGELARPAIEKRRRHARNSSLTKINRADISTSGERYQHQNSRRSAPPKSARREFCQQQGRVGEFYRLGGVVAQHQNRQLSGLSAVRHSRDRVKRKRHGYGRTMRDVRQARSKRTVLGRAAVHPAPRLAFVLSPGFGDARLATSARDHRRRHSCRAFAWSGAAGGGLADRAARVLFPISGSEPRRRTSAKRTTSASSASLHRKSIKIVFAPNPASKRIVERPSTTRVISWPRVILSAKPSRPA